MDSREPNVPAKPAEDEQDKVKRSPDKVDEDQLDEALEETFPASDPISP